MSGFPINNKKIIQLKDFQRKQKSNKRKRSQLINSIHVQRTNKYKKLEKENGTGSRLHFYSERVVSIGNYIHIIIF